MLSVNCIAVGEELVRRLSGSLVGRRLSPVGCAVLARLHALQSVNAQHNRPPLDAPLACSDGLELSCDGAESAVSDACESVSCDCGRVNWATGDLSGAEVSAAVDCVHRLAVAADSVWLETVLMQVDFETLYALTTHCRDIDRQRLDAAQRRRVEELVSADVSEGQSASQPSVVAFYSALFQLCLHSSALSNECRSDRHVQREVAAAVESVFPLSHLHDHAMRGVADRRRELDSVSDLVLGIRLFNQQIGKGGARLDVSCTKVAAAITDHNSQLEQESVFIGEIANTYTALLQHFHSNHGAAQSRLRREEEEKQLMSQHSSHSHSGSTHSSRAVSASSSSSSLTSFPSCLLDVARVHCELIHRRQYLLFLHALQSEGSASLATVESLAAQLDELFSQLTSIVGLRAAVPKQTVFPAFERVGRLYRTVAEEASKAELRRRLLGQLQESRNPFITSLTTAHIRQCKDLQQSLRHVVEPTQADFDSFVVTVNDTQAASDNTASNDSTSSSIPAGAGSGTGDECVRVTADSSPSFMSVALAYQGYCCVTLVRHSGFLLAGDAALGIIRCRQTHFAFASVAAMKAFVQQPQTWIQRVQNVVAVHYPPLVHLLVLQNNIPHTDIALYINDSVVQAAHHHTSRTTGSSQQRSGAAAFFPPLRQPMQAVATQTPTHFPLTSAESDDVGLQSLHWNEWEMRRRAIQMADLRNQSTHTTQTDKSHYRRDNSSQYTLPTRHDDGAMEAKATQTRIDKSTNCERTVRYVAGLRTEPQQHSHITNITLTLTPVVGEHTNPPLNHTALLEQRGDGRGYVVS